MAGMSFAMPRKPPWIGWKRSGQGPNPWPPINGLFSNSERPLSPMGEVGTPGDFCPSLAKLLEQRAIQVSHLLQLGPVGHLRPIAVLLEQSGELGGFRADVLPVSGRLLEKLARIGA